MIKTKVAFLEGRLVSSHSELYENFSDCSDLLNNSRPFKKHFCFDHVNSLLCLKSPCKQIEKAFEVKIRTA